jgi:heptosyltransferase-3
MRILFVSSNRIGDAVITCGVPRPSDPQLPELPDHHACGPAAEGVFARMPNRERTIVVVKHPHDLHWLKLRREVAFTLWDLLVDVRGSAFGFLVPTRRRAMRRGFRAQYSSNTRQCSA